MNKSGVFEDDEIFNEKLKNLTLIFDDFVHKNQSSQSMFDRLAEELRSVE